MQKETTTNHLGFLINLVCVILFLCGLAMFFGGVMKTISVLSPDYYWAAVGLGLAAGFGVFYIGGNKHGLIKEPIKLTIAFGSLITAITGLPIILEVMLTKNELESINDDLLYWGLPIGAFIACAAAGSSFVKWPIKNGSVSPRSKN